ncbi:MAG: HIRAN domain-containing protein [Mollicutes bacterium]|nr:HIRAN domain-containing protein [Mollicutes bacterium]MDD7263401.1 HIRAN domain-containing protein [bacterium]MDY4980015.1 HIRAN domain-containing protein [Candidatus Onthovivens sp.]
MPSFYIKAVGVTFENRQRIIRKLNVGDKLRFVLEPTNPYDKYAIKIVTIDGQIIGYVSKDYNQNIFLQISLGVKFDLTISSITGGGFNSSYGVNILVEY